MLSFNNIGNLGQLGNQMFQYAALCGMSEKIGTSCCCPYRFVVDEPIELANCFLLGHALDHINEKVKFSYNENSFSYSDSFCEIDPDGSVNIQGYFQSEKYFSHCRQLIKRQFTFKKNITDEVNEFIKNSDICMDDFVSIHVRRGDYLNLFDYHTNLSDEYYLDAMKNFPDKKFMVFSDDIEWCRNSKIFDSVDVIYSDKNQFEDLCLMSMCSGHIIANSSFSWWGSWLSGNKTIAPAQWFGYKGPSNWNDIYLSDWKVI